MFSRFIGCLLLVSACYIPPRNTVSDHPAPPPAAFWVVADTQFHNVAGTRTRTKIAIVDDIAHSAIRPPAVDLWSETLLSLVLERTRALSRSPLPVLFLGDGANTSCLGEYYRFLNAMASSPWYGVLGNHDGFYMGNYTFLPDHGVEADENTWRGACDRDAPVPEALRARLVKLERDVIGLDPTHAEQGTLSKATAVFLYVYDLHRRHALDCTDPAACDPLDPSNWKSDGTSRVFQATGVRKVEGAPHLVSVVASVATNPGTTPGTSRAWKAYVVQDVQLQDSTHAVLIDTSDFAEQPPSTRTQRTKGLFRPCNLPGVCGDVDVEQARKIDGFVDSIKRQGHRFFLAGHHHWAGISVHGANRLREAMSSSALITYVSGHMHRPTATAGYNGTEQWEINVASVTDWPMEFMKVAYWPRSRDRLDDLEVSVFHVSTSDTNEHACDLEQPPNATAELNYGDSDSYVRRALATYVRLLQRLRKSPSTVIQPFSESCPDACLAQLEKGADVAAADSGKGALDRQRIALQKLIEVDRSWLQKSPDVLRLERSCAMWASHLEIKGARKHPIKAGRRLEPETSTRYRVTHATPISIQRERVRHSNH